MRGGVAVGAIALAVLAAGCASSVLTAPVTFRNVTPGSSQEIVATLVRPSGEGPFPAVVQLHGCAGVEAQSYRWARWFADHGYVAMVVDSFGPRGLKGDCREGPDEPPITARFDDAFGALRYLQSLPYVDASRIGLWGGSYGGLLTALGLARNSDIFKAGVDFHGVHDWSAFLPRWFAFFSQEIKDVPDAEEARKLALESSPIASMKTWRSPVLLIQGDDDRNVPVPEEVDLVQRLREQKVELDEILLPDEIHDFLLWRNWMRAYQATADFFEHRLK